MRKPQIWAVRHEEFCNARVIRKDVRWPSLNFSKHLRMKVFDGIGHVEMFSYLRTLVNLFVKPNVPVEAGPTVLRWTSPLNRGLGRWWKTEKVHACLN